MEMNRHKIDICSLAETKRKGKGSEKYQNYCMFYSGKNKEERARAGVGLLIHERFEQNIENIIYIDERLMHTTMNFEKDKIHIISAYAPDMSKSREEREQFFSNVQDVLDQIPKNEKIFLMGDLNSRIGNTATPGVMQRFNEETLNNNGEMLISMCAQNELRINNTFFSHQWRYKCTWSNNRGQEAVLDYIITNRSIHPCQILDIRALNSANVGSDHSLILCKFRYNLTLQKHKQRTESVTKFNIESFRNDSTKDLYNRRLTNQINQNTISERDNVEQAWEKLSTNITDSAKEAIGVRNVKINKQRNTKPWFTEDIKSLAKEKRIAYLQYRSNKMPQEYEKYKQIRNRVNNQIQILKKEYWEKFSKDMEHDLYGGQKKIWNMLRNRKKPINESIQIHTISKEVWVDYFQKLYISSTVDNEELEETINCEDNDETKIDITQDDVTTTILKLKNRKSPGIDAITNEMIKYGGQELIKEITILFQKILRSENIPDQWRTSITIPLIKKGSKRDPQNYRGICLLSIILKLFTKIISQKITTQIEISEEQQGFRSNRSTIDAIFILRQLTEKSIEFNKPIYLCFVDFTQAFDRVQLKDVLRILQENKIDRRVIHIIKELNKNSKTRIKTCNGLTEEIRVATGIRQGDSLSPVLFTIVMDQIINSVKNTNIGYTMGNCKIQILGYADDIVLTAENEDDLQRLLHKLKTTAEQYNMQISTTKTQSMVISKTPTRCKLEVNGKSIEQVMHFKYLGADISSDNTTRSEVKTQTTKAAVISGCLRDIIWRNKNMTIESKTRIYKTCVRPVLTYAAETRADTTKTKQMMRAAEMKTLRAITGVSLRDRVRSERIRETCEVQDVVRWTRSRRRHWRDHVERMSEERLAKKVQTQKPNTRRLPGRPHKRWHESWTSTSQDNT